MHSWRTLHERRDVVAGCLFIAIAVLGFWLSADLNQGTLNRMGTGYFPRLICGCLLVLGVITLINGVRHAEEEKEEKEPPLFAPAFFIIPLALVAFGLTLPRLGFVLSSALMLLVGAFASRDLRFKSFLVLVVGLVASSVLIFVWLLGLPIPLWPRF